MPNEKFRDRFRIASARLPGWNYGATGWYFVTICVKNRECKLGDIIRNRFDEATVRLSPAGKIVLRELMETQFLRPYIAIDEYVIMPNHAHVLLQIHTEPQKGRKFDMQLKSDSLGVIIGAWKAKSTAGIRAGGDASFAWQERFHDAIIDDQVGIDRVRTYIRNNPREWHKDRNNRLGVYI